MQAVDATYATDGFATREAEDALRRAVGGATAELPFPGHREEITALAFNRDATEVATCAKDETLRVWSVMSKRSISGPLIRP